MNNKTIRKSKKDTSNVIIKGVPAGFPSPAAEFAQEAFDLNEYVVEHKAATYFIEVQGHSMVGAGIHTGDTLVVDRALDYKNNSIVVAVVDGEFTVKRVQISNSGTYLVAENKNYKPILLREGMNVEIWGVVTFVIHKV